MFVIGSRRHRVIRSEVLLSEGLGGGAHAESVQAGDHVGIAEDPGVLLFDGLGLFAFGQLDLGFRHELGHSGLGFLHEFLVGIELLLAGDSTWIRPAA